MESVWTANGSVGLDSKYGLSAIKQSLVCKLSSAYAGCISEVIQDLGFAWLRSKAKKALLGVAEEFPGSPLPNRYLVDF